MSTDNVLAVAAVARGNFALLLTGLTFSVPVVVLGSGLLADLMDKYPAITWLGAAILGRVAGEMIMTDSFVVETVRPTTLMRRGVEAGAAMIGLGIGGLSRINASSSQQPTVRGRADNAPRNREH